MIVDLGINGRRHVEVLDDVVHDVRTQRTRLTLEFDAETLRRLHDRVEAEQFFDSVLNQARFRLLDAWKKMMDK